jgi:hypothetical protein
VPLPQALGLLLLMAAENDYRYQRAALRWTQRVISEAPEPTLAGVSSLSLALEDLLGVSADVGRSRLALTLRQLGLEDAARVAERFT